MTEIKICGITDKEDALFAAECGVEALGFIFYPPSPRYISPEAAKTIISVLPAEVAKVGVFVNHDFRQLKEIADFCGLDLIQLHGDETPGYCSHFSPDLLIKAVSLQSEADLEALSRYKLRSILVDARDAGRYGGTGQKANWDLAAKVKKTHVLILSGGLNEENIGAAINEVSPQAVDINSGVESAPGRKDRAKVKGIVDIIRQIDAPGGEKIIFGPRGSE